MQIRLCSKTGDELLSDIIKGERHSVSHMQEIKNLCYELIFKAKRTGIEINHIEIIHTHLGSQYIEKVNDQIVNIKARGLSQTDLQTMKRIKPFIDYPIIIKSVCENGVSYCKKI